MEDVYILSGSNRGDRKGYLEQALALLSAEVSKPFITSGIYESRPWGFDDQVAFLNQVVGIRTDLRPEELLDKLWSVEARLGRVRFFAPGCSTGGSEARDGVAKYEGRTIDLDILFFGQRLVFTDRLMIPHPRLHERMFTLVPLNEIASGLMHPLLKKSIFTLLKECPDKSVVTLCE